MGYPVHRACRTRPVRGKGCSHLPSASRPAIQPDEPRPSFADNGHTTLVEVRHGIRTRPRSFPLRRAASGSPQPRNAAEARQGVAARRVGRRRLRARACSGTASQAACRRGDDAGRCAARDRPRLRVRELGRDETEDRFVHADPGRTVRRRASRAGRRARPRAARSRTPRCAQPSTRRSAISTAGP